jgi:ABC-type amino acid transport system permease subunit
MLANGERLDQSGHSAAAIGFKPSQRMHLVLSPQLTKRSLLVADGTQDS